MLKMQTEQQTFQQEAYMRQEQANNDPIKQIQADPTLTPAEKMEAITRLKQAYDPDSVGWGETEKLSPLMIGGLFIGGLFAMGLLSKLAGRKKNNAPMGV